MSQTYTLFDLQEHIRRVVALNYPEALWITAEIAQLSRSRGHVYLDLVQKSTDPGADIQAQAPAVLWQREYQKLRLARGLALEEVLQEGREVRMLVRVDYHERYGLKLILSDLDPAYTFGQLELQRRQTIQTLQVLGLLERNRALLLPPVLQRIAVVTSEGAAGFQDFREQLADNPHSLQFHCRLFSTAVQGKNAEAEIISAFNAVTAGKERYDCAVVLRGGGARLDLAAFDRLDLSKTAATLPVPLITGIGHDVDETVLDLVAHTALKTPTAVAEFLIRHNLAFENNMLQLARRLQETTSQQLNIKTLELGNRESALHWALRSRTRSASQQLETLAASLPSLARQTLRQASARLEHANTLCAALHPDAALRRGFSLTRKAGKVITDAADLAPGDTLETQLREGVVTSSVVDSPDK